MGSGMNGTNGLKPGISVIMPVYNVEAYVGDAIQSVLAQTWRDFELIIINDGSSDSSLEIAYSYAASDPRIKIISQLNKGLAAARNRGIEAAAGRYLYFFDSDDLLEIDTLATCMDYVERYNLDLVAFSGEAFADSPGSAGKFRDYQKPALLNPRAGQELLMALFSLGAYSGSACLYLFSRKLLDETVLRFDEGFLHEDEGFTPLLYCTSRRAVSLDRRFLRRRMRAHSIMTTVRTPANVEGMIQAVAKLGGFCDSRHGLNTGARRTLKARQRQLLRNALSIAEETGSYPAFVTMARARFGMGRLFRIDLLALLYVGFGRFFFLLRSFKRWVWIWARR